ncbi:MAG TPA: bifunctional diaminohydroxyphosphoribosylaminopyrimidine deaminase/5-amino-6-(5-phosphoribosylamino)uracil reductase RibD [Chitinophagaceae bacterium]|nr:bifunctional diaminohydroxyphosphoribosylaminopyrimidine deaminase/5-amino-6-(5-phosphoribosylamino)uracil reductase RibD [Chitinophagaceae bacterium]
MTNDELYMHRCLQLAQLAAGYTAPNPVVGAVLVHNGVIIGEGYHKQYGGPHAEVNCISSVAEENRGLIPSSTMYVSLEPCAHYGKTPPCADLIIRNNIPRVVVGCRDPFKQVDGKGIERLVAAGIDVTVGVLEKECKHLNRRFFIFHTQHRPYVLLKWAQTANGKIASLTQQRLFITNYITNKLVHKWRSGEAAILIGTNTARLDDPALNNRLWPGRSPVRMVVDMRLSLSPHLQLFNGEQPTIVFNLLKHEESKNITFYQLAEDASLVHQIINACYQNNIQGVMVEGGAKLLQQFIDEGMWDEARVITNQQLYIEAGLPAPVLSSATLHGHETIFGDRVNYFYNTAFPY